MIKDEHRESSLRKMKRLATGLLLLMTFIYFISKIFEKKYAWLGFIRASAEAAMVGALADWFAITALFRYPLGIPLPHTAIIPNNKDKIGESLGNFVQTNFLTVEAIKEKLQSFDIAGRGVKWLAHPENKNLIIDEFYTFIPKIFEATTDKDIKHFLDENISMAINSIELTPAAGHFLDLLTSNNKHQILFDRALILVNRLFEEYKPVLRRKIKEESPLLFKLFNRDDKVYQKFINVIHETLDQIANNPGHELRKKFDKVAQEYIDKLKSSSEYKLKGEALKKEFIKNPVIQKYINNVRSDVKAAILRNVDNQDSYFRIKIKIAIETVVGGLLNDSKILQRINAWIQDVIVNFIGKHRNEIGSLITEKIKKWDAHTVTHKLELQVGRDLQYIRINGTIIGGFVGLLIYSVSLLIP